MLSDRAWKGRLFRWWHKIKNAQGQAAIKFTPKLTMNRNCGWTSLELRLVNNASMTVWVEEAVVVLTDLYTSWQTSIPGGQAKHEIRQHVRVHESLELSLVQAIYDAAGRPQGFYSCLISVECIIASATNGSRKLLIRFK